MIVNLFWLNLVPLDMQASISINLALYSKNKLNCVIALCDNQINFFCLKL